MYHYEVDRMGCGGCSKFVTHAVLDVEPNAQVEVDLNSKPLTISGVAVLTDRIAGAIVVARYPAVLT